MNWLNKRLSEIMKNRRQRCIWAFVLSFVLLINAAGVYATMSHQGIAATKETETGTTEEAIQESVEESIIEETQHNTETESSLETESVTPSISLESETEDDSQWFAQTASRLLSAVQGTLIAGPIEIDSNGDDTGDSLTVTMGDATVNGSTQHESLTGRDMSIVIGSSDVTNNGNTYRVYFQPSKPDEFIFSYEPGKVLEFTSGSEVIKVYFKESSTPGVYYAEYTLNVGQTLAFSIKGRYPTITSSGGTLDVWGVVLTPEEKVALGEGVTYGDSYMEGYWTTKRDEYDLFKTSQGNVGIIKENDIASLSQNLNYKIGQTATDVNDAANGKDYTTNSAYEDRLTLPSGIVWNAELVEAVSAGNYRIVHSTSTATAQQTTYLEYVATVGGQDVSVARVTRSTLQGELIGALTVEGGQIVLKWEEKPRDASTLASSTYDVLIYKGALSVGAPASETTESLTITNTVNSSVSYTYTTPAVDTAQATTNVLAPLTDTSVILDKTMANPGQYRGEAYTWNLTLKNTGTNTCSDLTTLTDTLPKEFCIKGDDIEQMFKDALPKVGSYTKFEVLVTNGNRWVRIYYDSSRSSLCAQSYTGTDYWIGPALTQTGQGYYKSIDAAITGNVGAISSDTEYKVTWNLSGRSLAPGVELTFPLRTTAKDTYQIITDDYRNKYGAVTSTNTATAERSGVGTLYASSTVTPETDYEIKKEIQKDGQPVTSSTFLYDGDIIENVITYNHYGNGVMDSTLGIVDTISGGQDLLVPVEGNSGVSNIAAYNTKIEIDGVEYYVLQTNRYYNYYTVNLGNGITASSITVDNSTKTITIRQSGTIAPFIGQESGNYTGTFKYYTKANKGSQSETTALNYPLRNNVFMSKAASTTQPNLYDQTEHYAVGFTSFEKKIVTSGAGTPEEKLDEDDFMMLSLGCKMTYRLALTNGTQTALNISEEELQDRLPDTFGAFDWNTSNVAIKYQTAKGETPSYNYSVASAGEGKYILNFPNGLTVPADDTLYIYVTLSFPDNSDAEKTWTKYLVAGNMSEVWNVLEIINPETGTSWEDSVRHKLPPFEYVANKKVVESGAGTKDEVMEDVDNNKIIVEAGTEMTYKLTLNNRSDTEQTWSTADMWDELPCTYGNFKWDSSNVSVFYKSFSGGTITDGPNVGWRLQEDDVAKGEYSIRWTESVTVPANTIFAAYVVLKFPDDPDIFAGYWTDVYTNSNALVYNTFHVFEEEISTDNPISLKDTKTEKVIITSNPGQSSETWSTNTTLTDGSVVTYRLMLQNVDTSRPMVWQPENLEDILPDTYGKFSWELGRNVSIIYKDLKYQDSITPPDSEIVLDGETGLYKIKWPNGITVEPDSGVYVYVQLNYPSTADISSWNAGYNDFWSAAANKQLKNTFNVFEESHEVVHNVPGQSFNMDKKIVTGDIGTDAEQLEATSVIVSGSSVDYKLTIENTSSFTQQYTDEMVYDVLPNTYGTFSWVKGTNVSMTMKLMPSGNPVNVDYAITRNVDTGRDEIRWLSPLYVPNGQTLVSYVTLTYPSDTTFDLYVADASGDITNKFVVEDKSAEVSHQVGVPGKAILQKGVINSQVKGVTANGVNTSVTNKMAYLSDDSMYYSTNSPINMVSTATGARKEDMGVYYYIALYNGGSGRLYVNDIVDKLPDGFTYVDVSGIKLLDTIDRVGTNVQIIGGASSTTSASQFVDITDPQSTETPVFVSANLNAIADADMGGATFKISQATNAALSNPIGYDESVGYCYLEPGQAIAWGVVASSAKGTEDFATNTVTMDYIDATGQGVELPEGVTIRRNNTKNTSSSGSVKRFDSENNDGSSEIVIDSEGNATLKSQVTVQKGEIIPNIVKTTYDYAAEEDAGEGQTYEPYTNGVDRTDRVGFTINLTNDGTADMKDYTITETLQAPYRFIGPVYAQNIQKTGTRSPTAGLQRSDVPNHTRPTAAQRRLLLNIVSYDDDAGTVSVEEMVHTTSSITRTPTVLTLGTTYTFRSSWYHTYSVGGSTSSTRERTYYDICIDKDTEGNYTLSLRFYDHSNAIDAGGGQLNLQYEAYTPTPETTPYNTYYNNVSVTPNSGQVFAASKVSQGVVSDDGKSVSNYSPFVVNGGGGTSSEKAVIETANASNTATSSAKKNNIIIPDKNSEFYYTLNVGNINDVPISGMVIIDNLPQTDDSVTYATAIKRGSEFKVDLASNPEFNVELLNESGVIVNTLSAGSDYTIEYSGDTSFDSGDWAGSASGKWSSAQNSSTRSFRIVLNASIPAKNTVKVTFKAKIASSTVNPGQIAWNTFGYAYYNTINNSLQRLQGAPLKVGVRVPAATQLIKYVLDRNDNPLTLADSATFTYLIHSGTKLTAVDYTDQQALATALTSGNRSVTLVQVTVPAGSSASLPVTLENLKSYTWDPSTKTWTEGSSDFELTNGSSYVMSEINIAKEYEYVSLGGTKEVAYAFTYSSETNVTIDAVNKLSSFDGYKIRLTKTSSENGSALFGAMFALYSPLETEKISDADYSAIVLTPKPERTKTISGQTYYLSTVKESGADGVILWNQLRGSHYYAVEIKAPDGYIMDDSSKQIEVDLENSELIDYTYNLTVTNTPGMELPKTGGTGWTGYSKVGLILIIMTFTCLILWKKKLWIRRGNVK